MTMQEAPLVSIIVPVYNTESYLNQCLQSLQTQTIENIEIILINDGSTDKSGEICDLFANNDSRFKVIHKVYNGGLSSARNDGISFANADYIMFVDSDDWVEPDFCETPLKIAMDTKSELVIFQRKWHRVESKEQDPFPIEGIAEKQDILTRWWLLSGVVIWNKLYHKKLFKDIRFPVGRLSEDTAITHRLIYKANKVYLLNKCLYNHRINRQNSIKFSRTYTFIADEASFNLMRIHDLACWGYISKEKEGIAALSYLIKMGREAEMSNICNDILQNFNRFTEDSTSWKTRIMLYIYQLSPELFDSISLLSGRRVKN